MAGADLPVPDADDNAVLVRTGDGFGAARVLLLDHDKVEGLLVAMPERDLLWLGVESEARLSRLMAQNEKQSNRSDHPLSAQIYRMTRGELVPVTASGSGSSSGSES